MRKRRPLTMLVVAVVVLGLVTPANATVIGGDSEDGAWWKDKADYSEIASRPYPSYTYYSEIAGILRDIESKSPRVRVEVTGHSALGHDLFLVTVSDPSGLGRLGHYQAFRNMMLKDPAKAQAMLAEGTDFKVPIFINASIHGNETTGVDAALQMLRRLAFDDDEEVRAILDNTIVLINVVQNPDGRIVDRRSNGNGLDVNRDFITLSQPESRATAAAIVRWKPMIFLDLHGFVNPMLIEPCTSPHNPNYEYDLYIKWALGEAEAMRSAVEANTQFKADIPYLDYNAGWDDYPPIFTPMYAMYFGAVGHTLETPKKSEGGVAAHYNAIMAAAKYAAENKAAMFSDQIEIFRRGVESVIQPDVVFPYAYVLPMDAAHQRDPIETARAVDQLLFNGIEVSRATADFAAGGVTYPAGTYVVPMDQPLRALANTILWDGEDISDVTKEMYDIAAWQLPETWGFDAVAVQSSFAASLVAVSKAEYPNGKVEGSGSVYALDNDSNNAVRAVNELLGRGFHVQMTTAGGVVPIGTFLIPAAQGGLQDALVAAAGKYSVTFTGIDLGTTPAKTLRFPKVAVCGDSGTIFALRGMGFNITTVSPWESPEGFDVLVASSSPSANSVKAFVRAGGGYVGLGSGGAAGSLGNLIPVTSAGAGYYDNGVVRARYRQDGPLTAGYPATDYAFVYHPLWFTSVGDGVTVDAAYASTDCLMAGFWPGSESAAGAAAVVSGDHGQGKVVYIGFTPAFRAHPEATFRLLSNAIFFAEK